MTYKHAIVLGRFTPLHKGHIALIEQAISQSEKVTLLLFTSNTQKLPLSIRHDWLSKSFKDKLIIIPIQFELKNKDQNEIDSLSKIVINVVSPFPDVLFSSSLFMKELANKLEIMHEEVDIQRQLYSLRSDQILQKPLTYWNLISEIARPYFVKKICLMGPQSVGKSTLVEKLAAVFETEHVEETSRWYTDLKPDLELHDYVEIAKGKLDRQILKQKTANKVLFVDTDIISTRVYLDIEFQKQAHLLEEFFQKTIENNSKTFELYLLIAPKGEGVEDGSRRYNQMRQKHFQMIKQRLIMYKVPFVILDGSYEQNTEKAIKLTQDILSKY